MKVFKKLNNYPVSLKTKYKFVFLNHIFVWSFKFYRLEFYNFSLNWPRDGWRWNYFLSSEGTVHSSHLSYRRQSKCSIIDHMESLAELTLVTGRFGVIADTPVDPWHVPGRKCVSTGCARMTQLGSGRVLSAKQVWMFVGTKRSKWFYTRRHSNNNDNNNNSKSVAASATLIDVWKKFPLIDWLID